MKTKKLKGGSFFKRLFGKTEAEPVLGEQTGHVNIEETEKKKLEKLLGEGVFFVNNSGNTRELDLKLANKKRIQEIKDLRKNHSNKTPSIYIQHSHSYQLLDCLKVPKNTLIIFTGPSGVCSRSDNERDLTNPEFSKLLKGTEDKMDFEGMKARLKNIRDKNWFPDLTFHYSNYFGAKPTKDSKRQLKCLGEDGKTQMRTIESYTDHIYASTTGVGGFTTLDQYVTNINEGRTDSLDITPYHTKQLLGRGRVEDLKNNRPYFDIRDPNNNFEDFSDIQKLGEYYFNKDNATSIFYRMTYANTGGELYTTLTYSKEKNWSEIKLSELISINGAGIYIHHACRPFDDAAEQWPGRANSLNALEAHCPINPKVGIDQNVTVGKYKGCELIESITIGNENTIINGSFENCTNLQTVEFEEDSTLEVISQHSFDGCYSLKEIYIPDSVKKIGCCIVSMFVGKVFSDCINLKTIKFPQNEDIDTIYYRTFSN